MLRPMPSRDAFDMLRAAVTQLAADLREHRSEHERAELAAAEQKTQARRWRVGAAIAAVASWAAVMSLLVNLASRIH